MSLKTLLFTTNEQSLVSNGILAIPRFGLGDVLYTCIALSALRCQEDHVTPIVFCPPSAADLVALFGLEPVPLYSKALHLDRPLRTNLRREIAFWRTLRGYKTKLYFSLINDLFDALVCGYCAGHKPLVKSLGNYLQARPGGLRATINKTIGYRWNVFPNPKHILERAILAIKDYRHVTPTQLFEHSRNVLSSRIDCCSNAPDNKTVWEIVVLPDAASAKRCIETERINKLLSRASRPENCLVISTHVQQSQLPADVRLMNYPSLESLWCHLRR